MSLRKEEGATLNLKIFTDNIEHEALEQIKTLAEHPAFSDCKIRIMPDVHAGAGCVIGFTANLGDKVIPNIVGVDIGCGMLTVNLGQIDIDFEKLDKIIRRYIPSGFSVHSIKTCKLDFFYNFYCYNDFKNIDRLQKSLGTLGGGNHFIEIDEDSKGNKYLVIHTGSRNLGKQVANYYQNLAIERCDRKYKINHYHNKLIENFKSWGKEKEIDSAWKELHQWFKKYMPELPKELSYLTGKDRLDYLNDMHFCQTFASDNRNIIARKIISKMGWTAIDSFETIHNYISDTNIVRKGAISAKEGEKVLIPMNMRDGCIIAIGKGNEDWNCSAPHGAGRIISRAKAKESISMEEFESSMKGIYTTSINEFTLDESPMAYKPMEDIIKHIKDTVDIVDIIKPIYNFKASE